MTQLCCAGMLSRMDPDHPELCVLLYASRKPRQHSISSVGSNPCLAEKLSSFRLEQNRYSERPSRAHTIVVLSRIFAKRLVRYVKYGHRIGRWNGSR